MKTKLKLFFIKKKHWNRIDHKLSHLCKFARWTFIWRLLRRIRCSNVDAILAVLMNNYSVAILTKKRIYSFVSLHSHISHGWLDQSIKIKFLSNWFPYYFWLKFYFWVSELTVILNWKIEQNICKNARWSENIPQIAKTFKRSQTKGTTRYVNNKL